MLVVEGVSKRFGDLTALDDVHLEVEPGSLVGFLGPNGAGKTTTMRAIMGLLSLDAGEVRWDGRPVDAALRRRFGYMPAERGMYQRMRVGEHLAYYAALSGLGDRAAAVVGEWLDRLGLADRADDTVQSLSSGNQQRVQLALSLLNEPDLLVLDEPFSGLDPIAVDVLTDVLRDEVARGAALLLSSHQLDLVADVCTSVVIVDRGSVVLRGEVAQLRASSPVRYLDVEFASPTAPGWAGSRPATVEGRHHRLELPADAGPLVAGLLAAAGEEGEVIGHSFAPPDLSEVFLAAVGRHGGRVEHEDAGADG